MRLPLPWPLLRLPLPFWPFSPSTRMSWSARVCSTPSSSNVLRNALGQMLLWLAFLCARGRRRVVCGWVGGCPGQVRLNPLALVEEPLGLLEEALFLLALRVAA